MAVNEELELDGLDVNDEVNLEIEGDSFKFTPAQKKPQWIDNPDADGSALAYEPAYGNSEFAFSVRIVPQVDMDTALAKWGELQAKLQKASQYRDKGGIPLVWTPAGSTKTLTYYVLLGEISELPIMPNGDLAGWFLSSPVIQVKLTCRSFGYKEERTLLAEQANATPLQENELKEVGGDVPAEGRLIVIEKAAVDRRHLEWGIDQNSGATLLTAASLSTAGFTGVAKTRAGAYSEEKVIRAVAVTAPTVMCGTGNISHIGSYKFKARVYPTSESARFRISYRVGDGPFKSLPFVQAPGVNEYFELEMGEISLDEVELGTQRAEVRLESKSVGVTCENDVNYFEFIPTTNGYGKARGFLSAQATSLLAYDEFNQTAGALDTPKALPLGGNWSEASKTGASGFQINATSHVAERTALSDTTEVSGCYAIAGTTEYTDVQISVLYTASLAIQGVGIGSVFARYIDTNNWVRLSFEPMDNVGGHTTLKVQKRVAGAVVTLGTYDFGKNLFPSQFGIVGYLTFSVDASGSWGASYSLGGPPLIKGQHPDLATGGALAKGKIGMYDGWRAAEANTRYFDLFNATTAPVIGRVCFASKRAEVRSDTTERQDSTGTYYGPPSSYRGGRFYVPVGNSRLAVKMRRNDVDQEADAKVTDNQGIEVKIAERFLAPR